MGTHNRYPSGLIPQVLPPPGGSLAGRVVFSASQPGNPDAAVILALQSVQNAARISELVEAGYLVRTRADASHAEARNHQHRRS
ncbi:Ca2+-dependent phosphoinositide-specific phospholipase C [Rhodococcus sp. NPDC055112]